MRPPRGVLISFFVISLLSYQISYVVGQEGDSDIDLDDIKANASKLSFENSKIRDAYIALQYWKTAMFSDPFNFTANWTGPNVCSYGGVFCAPSLRDDSIRVVAGIDLNHADIAGSLVAELGLLTDLVLFHLNSNRFCGEIWFFHRKVKMVRVCAGMLGFLLRLTVTTGETPDKHNIHPHSKLVTHHPPYLYSLKKRLH